VQSLDLLCEKLHSTRTNQVFGKYSKYSVVPPNKVFKRSRCKTRDTVKLVSPQKYLDLNGSL